MSRTETRYECMADRQAVFMTLYKKCFPSVAHYIAKRGGTLDEAEDVFQDALLAFYEKTRESQLHLAQDEGAYVFGIARYLWKKRYHEHQRQTSLDELMAGYWEDQENEWSQPAEQQVVAQRVVRVLQAAGQQCMRLLTAFYYEKLDMVEIASRFGFSGARSATAQKFKCLQKVKQLVRQKSLQYEDFVE
ncbi:RNA polymerase sigma factor [Parapedobacter lycopersici]|uniref:RNA polymerase sigma factor n=1 Tax=Parapedobacter lycopersici TaxID=1864939 RepID=UPI00214D3C8D|nr:sigma-70 family RNA polymerase sigma factor [Parapedobacter lycopersici]